MPRLDWQMWFAALSRIEHNPWLSQTMHRLLENSPEVVDLFETNPFPDEPPRFVRAMLYRYSFTDAEERENSAGDYWKREKLGLYSPVMSR